MGNNNKRKRKIKSPKAETGNFFKPSQDNSEPDTAKYPIFCLKEIPNGKKGSIAACGKEDKVRLIERLERLSKMSWGDIRISGRHEYGTEKIPTKSLHFNPPSSIPDGTPILALRYNGLKPFLGYRIRNIFHIIYVDSKYDAYDHGSS